jgi:putative transcriptional regulator
MVKKKRSRILDAAHETAKGLQDAGVMDETAMREFNAIRLPPVKQCTAKDIRAYQEEPACQPARFRRLSQRHQVHRRALGAGVQEAPWPVLEAVGLGRAQGVGGFRLNLLAPLIWGACSTLVNSVSHGEKKQPNVSGNNGQLIACRWIIQ